MEYGRHTVCLGRYHEYHKMDSLFTSEIYFLQFWTTEVWGQGSSVVYGEDPTPGYGLILLLCPHMEQSR